MGDIVAVPLRGSWLGNRGILHEGTRIRRFHASNLWIICALEHKGWRLPQWEPHHFTVLFFQDEAVAMAAGHRPCALCRRPDYNAFRGAWSEGLGVPIPLAKEMDHRLHGERIVRGTHRRRLHPTRWRDLPEGAFILSGSGPALVLSDRLVPWTPGGYGQPVARPRGGTIGAITPPPTMAALRAGFRPQIDPSALNGTR